jgi:hypothetical protein
MATRPAQPAAGDGDPVVTESDGTQAAIREGAAIGMGWQSSVQNAGANAT